MKLTKSYLKKLIKEELEKEETLEDFVRRLVLKGYTPDAIHHAVQGTGFDAGHDDVVKAIDKVEKTSLKRLHQPLEIYISQFITLSPMLKPQILSKILREELKS